MGSRVATQTENDLLRRLESEYREMPGLVLTPQQAARLVSSVTADVGRSLEQLVGAGLLRKDSRGSYLRA